MTAVASHTASTPDPPDRTCPHLTEHKTTVRQCYKRKNVSFSSTNAPPDALKHHLNHTPYDGLESNTKFLQLQNLMNPC